MRRRALFRFGIVLAVAIVVVLLLSIIKWSGGKQDLYTVTAQQWEAALGDAAHIQTIYRNVTVEIADGTNAEPMLLATAGGGIMLDSAAIDRKLICVPSDSGFISYIWQYSTAKWETYDGKVGGVDDLLTKKLPDYVDTAMAGLQGEFGNATYDSEERCYRITSQKPGSGEKEPTTMHCRVYFEDGKLVKLATEITGQEALIVRLYDIGKTIVTAPQIEEVPDETAQ
ncbi:MAG: hypothetical protein E7461_04970 [Ruminococcaceae bacterium]|nr:hypothetical protein [Oscillospiraceae bacterium]